MIWFIPTRRGPFSHAYQISQHYNSEPQYYNSEPQSIQISRVKNDILYWKAIYITSHLKIPGHSALLKTDYTFYLSQYIPSILNKSIKDFYLSNKHAYQQHVIKEKWKVTYWAHSASFPRFWLSNIARINRLFSSRYCVIPQKK